MSDHKEVKSKFVAKTLADGALLRLLAMRRNGDDSVRLENIIRELEYHILTIKSSPS